MRSESASSSSRSSLTRSTAAPAFRAARMRSWISATAAKSSPNTGLATISTDTDSDSSRASTARCTLPTESVAMGASGPAEVAQGHVLGHGHPGHAGVAEGLLGQAEGAVEADRSPRGAVGPAVHADGARGGLALADEGL